MKKRWITIWILLSILSSSLVAWGNGYDNNFKVRVGIFYGSNAKPSYTIGGNQLYVATNNQVLMQTSANQMQVSRANIYYLNQRADSYEEASTQTGLAYYLNGGFFPARTNPTSGYSPTGQADILVVANDGRKLALVGSVDQFIGSTDDVVSINGTRYREKANIINNGRSLLAVNIVGLDHYLMGVVPKEMSPSWNMEALMAQSIVARNYVITNMNKHRSEGFNICNTTSCQVYGGMSAETQRTNAAVMQTSGMMMYYGGYLVEGYFHSSSGGRTESSANAWGGWKPYLLGTDDPFSLGSPHDLWVVQMSGDEIRQQLARSGVNVGEVTALTISKISENGRVLEMVVHGSGGSHIIKKDKIRKTLGSNKFKSTFFTIANPAVVGGAVRPKTADKNESQISTLKNMEPLEKVFGNLSIVLDKQVAAKESAREPAKAPEKVELKKQKTAFSPPTSQPVPPTAQYKPQYLPQPIMQNFTVTGNQFVFYGRGYGHGVGMSQYGAKSMGERGYNHQTILQYYFKGVTIAR